VQTRKLQDPFVELKGPGASHFGLSASQGLSARTRKLKKQKRN
jgi:hypothetical protein